MLRKDIVLEDGRILRFEPLNDTENAVEFRSFINALVQEHSYLLIERPVTLREENQWRKNQLQAQRNGEQIILKAIVDGKLIGNGCAKPGVGRNRGNVNLGIALARQWRGKGIGRFLIEELIVSSERKWHPKNIYLHVASANKKAQRLYESLGFRIIARLPEWFEYEEKYLDEYILLFDKKRFSISGKNHKKKIIQGLRTTNHQV